MNKENCVFCKIVRKEIPTEIVYESGNFICIPDKTPAAKGHTLIIPRRHYVNLMEMPEILGNEMVDMIKKVAEIRLREGAEGFNIIINIGQSAGQVVTHLHVHLIPRKEGEKVNFAH